MMLVRNKQKWLALELVIHPVVKCFTNVVMIHISELSSQKCHTLTSLRMPSLVTGSVSMVNRPSSFPDTMWKTASQLSLSTKSTSRALSLITTRSSAPSSTFPLYWGCIRGKKIYQVINQQSQACLSQGQSAVSQILIINLNWQDLLYISSYK